MIRAPVTKGRSKSRDSRESRDSSDSFARSNPLHGGHDHANADQLETATEELTKTGRIVDPQKFAIFHVDEKTYAVRQPTRHPVYEHFRVKAFAELLHGTLVATGPFGRQVERCPARRCTR